MRHEVMVGDILDRSRDVAALLLRGRKADLMYSDPPWGPGNFQYWHTYYRRKMGVDYPHAGTWPQYLARFADVANLAMGDGLVFIEMGKRWTAEVVAAMNKVGFRLGWVVEVGYSKVQVKDVICMGRDPAKIPPKVIVEPGDEWVVNRQFARLYAVRGGTLFEPCLGLGKAASCFAARGMTVLGLEMNPARFAEGEKRLARTKVMAA